MKKTKERRVLALIMAALMVLSVLLPGSGTTVRYMAEAAEAHDIQSFVDSVDLWESGQEPSVSEPKEKAWVINTDDTYRLHVQFAESSSQGKQFTMDGDNREFSYILPEGVKIDTSQGGGVHSPITIYLNHGAIPVPGTTYSATQLSDGRWQVTGRFSDDPSTKSYLEDAQNVVFYFDLDVQFDENLDEIDFGNNHKVSVEYGSESEVTVAKDGYYTTDDGKAHFSVKVTSTKDNTDIVVTDMLTGTAYTGLTIDSITTNNGADLSGVTRSVSTAGYEVKIPSMTDKQVITINYSTDIDYSKITKDLYYGAGTEAETANTVEVKSHEDPDPDSVTVNLKNQINYMELSKSGAVTATDADGRKTVTYTASYNNKCVVAANGITLTDEILDNYQKYPSDLMLTVQRYNKDGSKAGDSETVSPSTLADKKWTLNLEDTVPYRYEITYAVTVDTSDMPVNEQVRNKIYDDKGYTGETAVTVGPEKLNIGKNYTKVDLEAKTITWETVVTVPANGFAEKVTITDTVPRYYYNGQIYEKLVPGSLRVKESNGLSLEYTFSESYVNTGTFTLVFEQGIANPSGSEKTFTLEYQTEINDTVYQRAAVDANFQRHENKVQIQYKQLKGDASSVVSIAPPSLNKTCTGQGEDGGLPYWTFDVVVGNPQDPFTVKDSFDPELELVRTGDRAPKVTSGNVYYYGGDETKISDSDITAGEGSFEIRLGSSYRYADRNYYCVKYALKVKDQEALRRLKQRHADSGEETLSLENDVDVSGVKKSTTFTYKNVPMTKTLDNPSIFETADGINTANPNSMAEYTLVLNPDGLKLNGGKKYNATDTFENLAIDYNTITFDPADQGMHADGSGNTVIFYDIPDETPVTITYRSEVRLPSGADSRKVNTVVFKNTLRMCGQTVTSEKSTKAQAYSGGTGDIKKIHILKYEDGDLSKGLSNATFMMYDSDKATPMKWKRTASGHVAGEDVVFTTSMGHATISQEDVEFKLSAPDYPHVYYLKEIQAPGGYVKDDVWYQFELMEENTADFNAYQFLDGDTLKIRNKKPGIYFIKVDQDDAPLQGAEFTLYTEDKTKLQVCTSNADGEISFTDLPVAATGKTTYIVKETGVPSADYAIDSTEYKIVFTHDASGNIICESSDFVTSAGKTKRIMNVKGDYGTVAITKKLDTASVTDQEKKAEVQDQAFDLDFKLTAPAGATLPEKVTAVISKTGVANREESIALNAGSGAVALKDGETATIAMLPAGTQVLVKETADRALEAKGYTYDSTATGAGYTETVAKNSVAEITVNNTYTMATGELALKAYKTVDGAAIAADGKYDGKFSFKLEEITAGTVADKLTAAVTKSNAASAVSFDKIEYTEPATHSYRITEAPVDASLKVTGDATEYTLTVEVTRNAADSTKLDAAVTGVTKKTAAGTETVAYADGVGISFDNKVKTGELSVSKTVVSTQAGDTAKEFRFTVTLDDQTVAGTYGEMSFTAGKATFTLAHGEKKKATGLPQGIGYTVTETADDDFTTTKTDDTGTIGDAASEAKFTNTRKAMHGELALKAYKTVDGAAIAADGKYDGKFSFKLEEITAGTVADKLTAAVTKSNAASAVSFDKIEYTEPATHSYRITEAPVDASLKVTGDATEYTLTVEVTRNAADSTKLDAAVTGVTKKTAAGTETVAYADGVGISFDNKEVKGSLVITKTIKGAVTPRKAAGQLEFTITNETAGTTETVNLTRFSYDARTKTYSYEIEANPGDVYSVTETDYDVDGAVLETVSHKVMAGNTEEGASATGIVISSTEQTRVDFEDDYKKDEGVIHFSKYSYVNELCSARKDEIQPLSGVTFRAVNTKDRALVYYATSDAKGLVKFETMPAGTYEIQETACPEETELDDTVYLAVISGGSFTGLTHRDGTPVKKNQLINQPVRTDIEFVKVSEDEPTMKLEGSTYALFVESGEGSIQLIAQRTTGKDGKIFFEGVLPNKDYSIKEMTAPDGYYVSKNTVRIRFSVKVDANGKKSMKIDAETLDSGEGTIQVDKNGNITWLEPVVVAKITKLTKDGKLLAGATLRVEDEDGKVIIPDWVTGESETEISGKLVVGKTYRLVEVKAPKGYALAGPVSFKVSGDEVGPGEHKEIRVSMIDEELPPEKPPVPPTDTPQTSDDTPLIPMAELMTISLAGALVVGTKKRKLAKNKKK